MLLKRKKLNAYEAKVVAWFQPEGEYLLELFPEGKDSYRFLYAGEFGEEFEGQVYVGYGKVFKAGDRIHISVDGGFPVCGVLEDIFENLKKLLKSFRS